MNEYSDLEVIHYNSTGYG